MDAEKEGERARERKARWVVIMIIYKMLSYRRETALQGALYSFRQK